MEDREQLGARVLATQLAEAEEELRLSRLNYAALEEVMHAISSERDDLMQKWQLERQARLSLQTAAACVPCRWLGNSRTPDMLAGANLSAALYDPLQQPLGHGACPAALAAELCPPSASMRPPGLAPAGQSSPPLSSPRRAASTSAMAADPLAAMMAPPPMRSVPRAQRVGDAMTIRAPQSQSTPSFATFA